MKPPIADGDHIESLETKLFASLGRDEPPVSARRAVAASLGLGTGVVAGTAGAQGATAIAKLGPLLVAKWVGIGTVAGLVSVGAAQLVGAPRAADPAKPATTIASPKAARGPVATSPGLDPAASADVQVAPESTIVLNAPAEVATPAIRDVPYARPATEPSAKAPARAPKLPAVVSAVSEPKDEAWADGPPASTNDRPLAVEVSMLDDARHAIAVHDGNRALEVLQRYTSTFSAPTLNLEATALRIEALLLTGSYGAAGALGREFLQAYPNSTHATRIRRLLAEHEKP